MDALVVYRYRAADAQWRDEVTIRSEQMDVDLLKFETSPHMAGATVTLQPEDEDEEAIERLGKEPREFVVSNCVNVLTQVTDHPYHLTVYVYVTDPAS